MCFYKNSEGQTVRHTIMQMSDDLDRCHDKVQHLPELAVNKIKEETHITSLILWSDGCAQQYKVYFCFGFN